MQLYQNFPATNQGSNNTQHYLRDLDDVAAKHVIETSINYLLHVTIITAFY